jgi:hypothetical protein
MTNPAIIFGLVLASLYGSVFHLWRGGKIGRLLLYILFSEAGFWAGQAVGSYLGWNFATVGPLNAGMGTLGSVIFLFVGYWLSLVEVRRK